MSDPRYSVSDDDSGWTVCDQGKAIAWARGEPAAARSASALNACEPGGLLKMACVIIKRAEDCVADYADDMSHDDPHGLTLRLMHDWLRDYKAWKAENR